MESHVLIPGQLSLHVRPVDSNSVAVARMLEPAVAVTARVDLPRGTVFRPNEGTVCVARLDVYSTVHHSDPRSLLGCLDEIVETSCGRRVRRCNWVRFLATDADSDRGLDRGLARKPNLAAVGMNAADVTFVAVEDVPAGAELVVASRVAEASPLLLANAMLARAISCLMQDSPLDLSKPLLGVDLARVGQHHGLPGPPAIEQSPTPDSGVSSGGEDPVFKEEDFTEDDTDSNVSADDHNNNSSNNIPSKQQPSPSSGGGKRLLPCGFCGKAFDRPSLLNRHLRTHTGERPHVCDVCQKGFSTSSSLNTHRRIHSGEKPHECNVCGKRFTASSNLYYHRMTHVKEKPHRCELCLKTFPTPGDLKSHMYIHNGSWPHRCNICHRGFSKITNLKNHLFLHTGQKPHGCPVCHKRFALGCNMKAHMKTHEATVTVTSAAKPVSEAKPVVAAGK